MKFRTKHMTRGPRQSGEVFSSCAVLPLDRFIRATVFGDLTALIRKGSVPDDQLQALWKTLQIEYIEASSGTEELNQLIENSRCSFERSRIARVRRVVLSLQIWYDQEVASCLREDEFEVPGPDADPEELAEALSLILNLLMGDELRLELAGDEQEDGKKVAVTESWFYDILNAAGKVAGHAIPENMTTLRFARYYLELKQSAFRTRSTTKGTVDYD